MGSVRAAVRWASLALLFLLIATPLAQIVMRSVFNVPMAGAEELMAAPPPLGRKATRD